MMLKQRKQNKLQFENLKINDTVFIMRGKNVESKTIRNVSSRGGIIGLTFNNSNLCIKVKAKASISFDESTETTVFTNEHKLMIG